MPFLRECGREAQVGEVEEGEKGGGEVEGGGDGWKVPPSPKPGTIPRSALFQGPPGRPAMGC